MRKLVSATHTKLGVNIRYVGFHRVDGNAFLLSNLLVRCALFKERQQYFLALGQPVFASNPGHKGFRQPHITYPPMMCKKDIRSHGEAKRHNLNGNPTRRGRARAALLSKGQIRCRFRQGIYEHK